MFTHQFGMMSVNRSIIMNGEKGVHGSGSSTVPVKMEPLVATDSSYQGGETISSAAHRVIVPNASVLLQQYRKERAQNGISNGLDKCNEPTSSGSFNHLYPPASQTHVSLSCIICGDRTTGKHYGAHSCDGCKGFFRRSVRKNQNYSCRYNRNCTVNKDKRNQCRYCRFTKCISAGMKKEAVQNERDRIHQRRPSYDDNNGISLHMLLTAENKNQNRQIPPPTNDIILKSMKVAAKTDVVDSMKQQLIGLVDWAQSITTFNNFGMDDRVNLLRARASEQLILGVAWRSLAVEGVLLLGNSSIIPRDSPDPELNRMGIRVMDELVRLYKDINMDEQEYACLKAIVFFDPSIRGLQDVIRVKSLRYNIQLLLEDYINDRPMESRGRFGQLLLSLQVLQSISWKMVELVHFAELFGETTNLDSFLAEMILGDCHRSTSGSPISGDDSVSSINLEPASSMEPSPPVIHDNELRDSTYEIISI